MLAAAIAKGDWLPEPLGAVYGPLPVGQWMHLAMVYDRQTVRLFVNGQSVVVFPAPDSVKITANDLVIGRSPDDAATLNALVREVRLSDVARYTEDFAPATLFEPDENTLMLLHCDEGSGPIARDLVRPRQQRAAHGGRLGRPRTLEGSGHG